MPRIRQVEKSESWNVGKLGSWLVGNPRWRQVGMLASRHPENVPLAPLNEISEAPEPASLSLSEKIPLKTSHNKERVKSYASKNGNPCRHPHQTPATLETGSSAKAPASSVMQRPINHALPPSRAATSRAFLEARSLACGEFFA